MKGVVFDIEGNFAHFRKFYTNSSSLSYSLPPRTTIEGLLASFLGFERDSYYEKMSSEKLHIAVKKNLPTRSITQTLNYIKATSVSKLNAPDEHTQIPFEVITGGDNEYKVSYRIYAASDEDYMDELQDRLVKNKLVYPPSLGTVFFQGSVENVSLCEILPEEKEEYVKISSIVLAEEIEEIKLGEYQLVKERMPRDFGANRQVKKSGSYIFDQRGKSLEVKFKRGYYAVNVLNGVREKENIVFM
ncbi:CRISPR-associated protein Cas5 [Paratissierella segnis]|jgi:CRISPR-associated protein Cas5h|uniref:CRISPR-associated protein Cas5 n=1 Tax=Paratissierella segnis TaxID=2763679 RepID=A0A926IKC3_9FIRM|nr:CRISPR-associated protein Cas5 [Paratissierella segnis]MBC8587563.1 CRISPR-associated protein Cas5 [Paratissierella segnis]